MSGISVTDIAKMLVAPSPVYTLAPGFGTPGRNARTALKRCCSAWQRAFDATLDGNNPGDDFQARRNAARAYCNAMPLLTGYAGVRDFIACVAHGILIGAVPQERAGQLLYAAQVALGSYLTPLRPQNREKLPPPWVGKKAKIVPIRGAIVIRKPNEINKLVGVFSMSCVISSVN